MDEEEKIVAVERRCSISHPAHTQRIPSENSNSRPPLELLPAGPLLSVETAIPIRLALLTADSDLVTVATRFWPPRRTVCLSQSSDCRGAIEWVSGGVEGVRVRIDRLTIFVV